MGGHVAGHRSDGQVLVTSAPGLLGHATDQQSGDAVIPSRLGDDDRLDFSTRTPVERTGQTDDQAAGLGHPRSDPVRLGEVVIESRSGIVSADRRVAVDAPVVFRQLCP
jgi:hypothetical protein